MMKRTTKPTRTLPLAHRELTATELARATGGADLESAGEDLKSIYCNNLGGGLLGLVSKLSGDAGYIVT